MAKVNNLIGRTFGDLTCIERAENTRHGKSRWLCKCSCGNTKIITGGDLTSGDTTSCGCKHYAYILPIDLTGKRFGKLVVLSQAVNIGVRTRWVCSCDCGIKKTIDGGNLRNGTTRSCGCLRREVSAVRATKHGHCGEKLYGVWGAMLQRCSNTKSKDFKWYGARGIRVCPEWSNYEPFRNWALNNGYSEGLTIDRIDVDGMYCPENCRWIPIKEQQMNRRSCLSYRTEETRWKNS